MAERSLCSANVRIRHLWCNNTLRYAPCYYVTCNNFSTATAVFDKAINQILECRHRFVQECCLPSIDLFLRPRVSRYIYNLSHSSVYYHCRCCRRRHRRSLRRPLRWLHMRISPYLSTSEIAVSDVCWSTQPVPNGSSKYEIHSTISTATSLEEIFRPREAAEYRGVPGIRACSFSTTVWAYNTELQAPQIPYFCFPVP